MVKVGFDQFSKLPPLWWRRLERTVIIGLAPAATAFIMNVLPAEHHAHALQILTFCVSLVKSAGLFLGSDQSYADEKPAEENPQ